MQTEQRVRRVLREGALQSCEQALLIVEAQPNAQGSLFSTSCVREELRVGEERVQGLASLRELKADYLASLEEEEKGEEQK